MMNDNLYNHMAVGLMSLFFLIFLFLIILSCRPWRFFFSHSSSRPSSSSTITAAQTDDIERPLFSERDRCYLAGDDIEQSTDHADQGDSLILEVLSETADNSHANQTVKRALILNMPVEDANHVKRDTISDMPSFGGMGSKFSAVKTVSRSLRPSRSNLNLKVISGPSYGLCCSRESTTTSMLPVTIGRVPPSDYLVKDSEVSGKHASINWNNFKSKWEMLDLGSLNGTFLNSCAIQSLDSNSRHWSEPVELGNGDIITLGTSSKISVQISQDTWHKTQSGVGVASDPMASRRGGKQLPMEDVCYYQCPLTVDQQFGIFGIFDGHGGDAAAKTASKMLPAIIGDILSIIERRERVISSCNATEVLKEAFRIAEDTMNHQYEGCTATILLVWIDHNEEVLAQCANVGDSACVINVSGQQITMTEDHRVTAIPERTRFSHMGMPLKDGETRICGINLGRMLGDKFLKEHDARFSAEPYVSQVVRVSKACTAAFALLASDGLWDVINIKKVVQLVVSRYKAANEEESDADKMASYVLEEARTLRTKDNTSVIFLDFDSVRIYLRGGLEMQNSLRSEVSVSDVFYT